MPTGGSQQRKFRAQEREPERDFSTRESHYVWGKRYLLKVEERDAAPTLELKPRILVLGVRPGTDKVARQSILEKWYRDLVRSAVHPLIVKWERRLEVHCKLLRVQRMRTRWGSCNSVSKSFLLNSELAKKPLECLEYILVHELAHLVEPTHNARFQSLMDHHLPQWRHFRQELNRAPLAYEKWEY
jgi:predicted metal-dependent hydrolase